MSAPAIDDDILARIGNTPLVRLRRLPGPGAAEVLCKCEQLNPGGSVKDRTALAMVEAGEREGRLIPGRSVIIEATSGNTGIGLALVAAVKGYRLILTMPENMSAERMELLRAYGAELHLTPADRVMRGAVEKAAAIATASPHAFQPQQFKNPVNAVVHRTTTGPEILAQLGDRAPDAFVAGVGTGGTITGVGQALRARRPGRAAHRRRAGQERRSFRWGTWSAPHSGDRRRVHPRDPRPRALERGAAGGRGGGRGDAPGARAA